MTRFLPPAASAHAPEIDWVLTLVHLLMLALFLGWGAYFVWVLFRFRARRQPRADHAGAKGSLAKATEVGVVVAEGLLLVVIALPLWFSRTSAQPEDIDAVAVRVVAEQFAWNFHYPGADGQFGGTSLALVSPDNPLGLDRSSPFGRDDIVVPGELHLPVGRPVIIQLSSKDVIHSFGVPAMRVKQDAIPGLLSPVWFTPTETGRFDIACSQLCGLGHYRMRGIIAVESAEDFAAFLSRQAEMQIR
jgi:cytochrome c oxidase subunit 2